MGACASRDDGAAELPGVEAARVVIARPSVDARGRPVYAGAPYPGGQLLGVASRREWAAHLAALDAAVEGMADGGRGDVDGAVRAAVTAVWRPVFAKSGVRVDVVAGVRPPSGAGCFGGPGGVDDDGGGADGSGAPLPPPIVRLVLPDAAGRPAPADALQQRNPMIQRPKSLERAVLFLRGLQQAQAQPQPARRSGGARGGGEEDGGSESADGDGEGDEGEGDDEYDVPVPQAPPRRRGSDDSTESDLSTQVDVREVNTSAKSWSMGMSPSPWLGSLRSPGLFPFWSPAQRAARGGGGPPGRRGTDATAGSLSSDGATPPAGGGAAGAAGVAMSVQRTGAPGERSSLRIRREQVALGLSPLALPQPAGPDGEDGSPPTPMALGQPAVAPGAGGRPPDRKSVV